MPYYYGLRSYKKADRQRVINNILTLREQLKDEIPERTAQNTLLLATWNIRDFDSNKFGHGPREKESMYYIAEIIAAFDLVAVQEVNQDLRPLKKLLGILGAHWDYIVTDTTEGRSGNNERMAYLYDTNKVAFKNIAGELVLPQGQKVTEKGLQFARTPFMASFQSGWFRFFLTSVHIYYGSNYGDKFERRVEEISRVAKMLSKRSKENGENYILLGDFNIIGPNNESMYALTKTGFMVPSELRLKTNVKQDKYYDQIAFMVRRNKLKMGPSKKNAGVFKFFDSVFPDNPKNANDTSYQVYASAMRKNRYEKGGKNKYDYDEKGNPRDEAGKRNYYRNEWRTFQLSDHLPLWVELKIDYSNEYLDKLKK